MSEIKLNKKIIRKTNNDPRLKDKLWRLNHLYKIKNKNKEVITFKLNRAQLDFHNNKHYRNIILKSRQLGFTTYEAIDALDDVLFEPNTDALMRSYDLVSQLDIFNDKIVFAWNNLSPEIQKFYTVDTDRANMMRFGWGDNTLTSITVRLHGRSGTFSRMHISEFAKICKNSSSDADEIITGNLPAVPINGRVDIESTAEGDYGDFHDMFWEAWNRGTPKLPIQFRAFFYNWQYDDAELEKIIPIPTAEMDESRMFEEYKNRFKLNEREITYYYYRWLSLNKDWQRLKREYPTTPGEAFEASGDKFFSGDALDKMKTRIPAMVTGMWTYYEDYKPGHRYALAADPSGGIGKDNAVIIVVDFDAKDSDGYLKPEIVAVYANSMIAPDMFAYEVKNGGTKYGNCIVAVENNNHGQATLANLKKIYYNIYKEIRTDKFTDIQTERLGWHTNRATKAKMMFDIKTAVNENLINITDAATLREFKTYLSEDLNTVGLKDDDIKHWDRVIALAICWQMAGHAGIGTTISISDSDGEFNKFGLVNII